MNLLLKRPYFYLRILPAIYLFTLTYQTTAQIDVEGLLEKYSQAYIPEIVFVHTDKNIYAAGETLWMALYLMDGQFHTPTNMSKTVRVEVRNDTKRVIAQQMVFSNNGHMVSEVALPDTLRPGDYLLTAYTNNQRNIDDGLLFTKTIKIIEGVKVRRPVEDVKLESDSDSDNNLSKYENTKFHQETNNVRFFPESGDCIVDLPCRMAFIAEDANKNPIETTGFVKDENGDSQAIFRTNKFGIGTFNYQPKSDLRYVLVDNESQRNFKLPRAKERGINLAVQKSKGVARFILNSNLKNGLKGSKLIIHLRGVLLIEQELSTTNQRALLDIPLEDLSEGVLVATVFDATGLPRAERLFFISPDKEESKISITANKEAFKRREEVELRFTIQVLKDESKGERSISSDLSRLSLSILPTTSVIKNGSDDIRSYLLLNSDLDFPIYQSADLIYNLEERLSDKWIDDFLMTRGWRRFDWEKLATKKAVQRHYRFEQGIHIEGRMSDFDNERRARPGKVFLTRMSNAFTDEVVTDDNGFFNFGPYEVFGSLQLALNGRFKLGKKNRRSNKTTLDDNSYCQLEITKYNSPNFIFDNRFSKEPLDLEALDSYRENSKKFLEIENAYDGLTVELDNVDIKGKKIERSNKNIEVAQSRYGQPDARVKASDVRDDMGISPVFNMLTRIAGVRVTGARGKEQIVIRGVSTILAGKEPLYIVDGIEVDISGLRDISSGELDFIDVLTGAGASFYGSRASNGVIVVYTKRGNFFVDRSAKGLLYTQVEGYHEAKEFAIFDYDGVGNQNRPDVRTTLHWNGFIETNSLGEAIEIFTTSDQSGTYTIIVQGLRNDGQPLYGKGEIRIE